MATSSLYAAIDLGSNSFHMLVVQQVEGACRTLAKVKRKVRLAAGLQPDGSLDQAAMERGWDCLQLFAEQLQDVPADQVRIVGTATLRLATNIDTFLTRAETILGHSIHIISGEEEAATIYQGVAWTSSGTGRRLVIDIGGASTELVIGEGASAELLHSLNMGCVTWLKRYFPDGELSESSFASAISAARRELSPVAAGYLKRGWQHAFGASGTVQAIQEIMMAQGENEHITLAKLLHLREQAIACGHVDRLQLTGLTPERTPVFASGLAILIALFETLGIDNMVLAGGALREGLVYGMLGTRQDCDAQDRTIDSLIARYQLDREQGERVRNTALLALKQLQPGMDNDDACMLARAAMLYELGLCIEYKRAPEHAAYIIRHIDLPGFTAPQQRLLAALLLNQRDEFRLEALQAQCALDASRAVLLARLLRLAIILCLRRTKGTVPEFRLTQQGERLTLTLPAGWCNDHHLRATELQTEAKRQSELGWPLDVVET
ncbi:guanosine-5'-triphosphate,3'-diphosphate diphosphatase [Oceanimonas sp. CHS3-5]|uniref:guanosine-5'-triphosphate,3'-diphosphate diphosphatase n=1 Tax=Oceanimonas sp. CHS3-5 TaxID=3068186 RepID=UPI00273DBCB4|nr:guanosine-5'-triphosphate,3'-diphosphate diphosphatase [Oceanimonas sp. CHS3-5]MDP5293830.1 guanosine-5'-triphosphate,3'-diphosphate diphosphatase [Oceanimonas sp. CHS3-5]